MNTTTTEPRDESWARITDEARAQVSAELVAADGVLLAPGSVIAWTEKRLGRTDGLSVVHRVGEAIGGDQRTLCGDIVPAPLLQLALTPGFIRTLGRCRYCESLYARIEAAA